MEYVIRVICEEAGTDTGDHAVAGFASLGARSMRRAFKDQKQAHAKEYEPGICW